MVITGVWCFVTLLFFIRDLNQIRTSSDEELLSNKRLYETYATNLSVGGVLGTFFGIAYGLWDFDSENLDASVPQLLDGLKFAFFTSIIGMIESWYINKYTSKIYDRLGETDITTAALNLSKTVEDLKSSIENNNTKALESAMKKITETFEKEMNKVSTELTGLMKKLVDKNFEELNKSINSLNTWQQENKEQIGTLTENFKTAVSAYEQSATAITNITKSTQELIGEEGELTKLINNLKTVMIDDENFVTISNNITTASVNLKQNSTEWQSSLSNLKTWVESQKGLNEKVSTLIMKLDELNKQRDYNEEFWKTTRKGMQDASSIIGNASSKLKNDLEYLDEQFYQRLNTTLSNLDDCIEGFMRGRR